jgi:hypothetical protein
MASLLRRWLNIEGISLTQSSSIASQQKNAVILFYEPGLAAATYCGGRGFQSANLPFAAEMAALGLWL